MMSCPIENGKYSIEIMSGKVTLMRHGEVWIEDPPAPKMLISIAYELHTLRQKVKELKK